MARLLLSLCLLILVSPVIAAERVALVIGNNAYTHARKLETAKGDAEAVATKLRGLDFEVALHTDLTEDDFPVVVAEFLIKAQDAKAVLVYYAGHGMESPALGGNYLIPVDAVLEKEAHLESQAYALNTLLDRLRRLPADVRIVILDCCRNNPLEGRAWSDGRGSNGLAAIDLQRLGGATMVVYSASPGKIAKERIRPSDLNGPFATALLQEIGQPGATAISAFASVEDRVFEDTRQVHGPRPYSAAAWLPSIALSSRPAINRAKGWWIPTLPLQAEPRERFARSRSRPGSRCVSAGAHRARSPWVLPRARRNCCARQGLRNAITVMRHLTR